MKRQNSQKEVRHDERWNIQQQHFPRQQVPSPVMSTTKEQRDYHLPRTDYVQSPRNYAKADNRPPLPISLTPIRENRDPGGQNTSYRNVHTPQEHQQQSGNRLVEQSVNRSHAEWQQQSANSAASKYKQSQILDRGHTEPDEPLLEFEHKRQKQMMGSNSHGRLPYFDEQLQGMTGSASTKNLDKGVNNSATLYEYRHLHEKLNTLENKILSMRTNLEKKKEDKKKFLEEQIRDRKERQRQMKDKADAERREREFREARRRQQDEHSRERERSRDKQKSERQRDENLDRSSTRQEKKKPLVTPTSNESSPLKGLVTQVPQHKQLRYFDFNPYSPRNNIYYVSEVLKAYKEEKSLVREHLLSSMHLLKTLETSKRPTMFDIAAKNVNLIKSPLYKDKKTVVFDLDETLIHCNESTNIPYDAKIPIKFPTGEIIEAGINIRPYAHEILRNLSEKFEIIVFTASHSCYANVVLDTLDPDKKYIQHRLFREHCHSTSDGMFVKDLRVINRPLSEMVLVDNAAYSYAFQPENGIPIIPYYEGRNDYQLSSLEKYLQTLLLAKDVRDVNRKTFKLEQYRNYDDPGQLVKELYNSHQS